MTIYNQRNSRWANTTLGTKGTIGNLGCTITAITQLLTANGYNITPPQVNERLKQVGGYSNGNLVIWSKLSVAYPQIKSATRHWSYNNDIAVQAIKDNKGILVEVDGSRIGAPRHWILYIGGGKALDPWTGKEIATSYYPTTGMSVLEVEPKQGGDMMQIEKKTFEELVGKATKYDNFASAGYNIVEDVIAETSRLKSDIITIRKQRDVYRNERDAIKDEMDVLAELLKECRDSKPETPPVSDSNPPTMSGWKVNGLSVRSGDKTWNYKRSED